MGGIVLFDNLDPRNRFSGTHCDVIHGSFVSWSSVKIAFEHRTSNQQLSRSLKMVMPFWSFLRTSILFAATFSFSQTQIFTALIHMTDFVVLEQSFYSYLEKYLQNKPSASSEFHRFAHLVGQHVKDIEDDDMEVFLGHPVNSYLLVRRFFRDWRIVMEKLAATDPVAKGNE